MLISPWRKPSSSAVGALFQHQTSFPVEDYWDSTSQVCGLSGCNTLWTQSGSQGCPEVLQKWPLHWEKTNKQTKIIWCTEFLFLLLITNLIFFSFVQNKQIKEWKNLVTFLFSSPASLKLLPIMSFETKWKQKKNSFCWEQTGPVDPLLMISLLQVLMLSTSNKPSCV